MYTTISAHLLLLDEDCFLPGVWWTLYHCCKPSLQLDFLTVRGCGNKRRVRLYYHLLCVYNPVYSDSFVLSLYLNWPNYSCLYTDNRENCKTNGAIFPIQHLTASLAASSCEYGRFLSVLFSQISKVRTVGFIRRCFKTTWMYFSTCSVSKYA